MPALIVVGNENKITPLEAAQMMHKNIEDSVLFLKAFTGHLRNTTILLNKYFRAIGISLRGFGKSDKPNGNHDYSVHASDIKKVLEKLKILSLILHIIL